MTALNEPMRRRYKCCSCGRESAMQDAAEMLWVVMAYVNEGNWSKQSQQWQDAAAK